MRRPALTMTLIELLAVAAIIAILASFTLTTLMAIRRDAGVAITKNRVAMISKALEVYHGEAGLYPRDPAGLFGADIPEFLFAALNNKGAPSLGGVGKSPLLDVPSTQVGLLTGESDEALVDGQRPHSATRIGSVNQHTLAFQASHKPRRRTGLSMTEAKGLPVFLDEWGNPIHYREWASKSAAKKEKAVLAGDARERCQNPGSFQVWSNGPDGINDYGAAGSDDICNWVKGVEDE